MKHKNISTQSGRVLSYFNQADKSWFSYEEAAEVFSDARQSGLKELLSDMVRRGLLMRLKKGLYHLVPYEQDSESFMPDWHLLAQPMTKDVHHYIGYFSALQIHQLTTQPSLKEQIVVSRQLRPSQLKIKNVTFQFVYHNPAHFFGSKTIWIDNYNKVLCSDLEKTLIDCLFKPDYAGGIVEIAKAIYMSRDRIDYQQLLDYTIKFDSQAVVKRLGYLLELLEIRVDIIEELHRMKTNSFVMLDTELPKQGKLSSRWSIQQNLDSESIKSTLYT